MLTIQDEITTSSESTITVEEARKAEAQRKAEEAAEAKWLAIPARKRRRLEQAYLDRRQRKGQRRFYAAQIKRRFHDDTVRSQMSVLEAGPEHPMYANVYNALVVKFGDQLPAA